MRKLLGLGISLVIPCAALAQEHAPAARLGVPTIRAQSPDVTNAAGFDIPKAMPKGAVTETPSRATPTPGAPSPLPMPAAPMPGGPIAGPALNLPPGATIVGPVVTTPGPVIGEAMPPGAVFADPAMGGCPAGATCADQSNWYVGFEALIWWVENYQTPPLLTTGPTFSGGVLNTTNVTTLYGGPVSINETNPRYGGRLTLGYWFSPCWAVELNGFYFPTRQTSYRVTTADVRDADLARPFFSANSGTETSQIISRAGVVSGSAVVITRGELLGGELNARRRWWNDPVNRLDLLFGFRYMFLQEELEIGESVLGLAGAGAAAGISRSLSDNFQTRNNFYGLQVGGIYTYGQGSWTFGVTGKIAAGVSRQYSNVSGGFTGISGGAPPDLPGGLLALSSNIGEQLRDRFAIMPEIGFNVGYDINSRLRIFAGYSIIYWSNVLRPGQQIDRTLDENLIPDWPARPPATQLRPVRQQDAQALWIQGANVGLLWKW